MAAEIIVNNFGFVFVTIFGLVPSYTQHPVGIDLIVNSDVTVSIEHQSNFIPPRHTVIRFAHNDVIRSGA